MFPSPLRPCVLALMCFIPVSTHADQDSLGTLGIYLENDAVGESDGHYSSGLKLSWSSPDFADLQDCPYPSPLLGARHLYPDINHPDYRKNVVYGIGQNIYTPLDTDTANLVLDDRPYAGWLYLAFGLVWKTPTERNSLALDIGVVGPWALGEETQGLVHGWLALDNSRGWDKQLDNELGIILSYEKTWRLPVFVDATNHEWEVLPHAGVALGNVRTSANLGGEIRWGKNLPQDFGTSQLGATSTTSTPFDPASGVETWGFYIFTRADAHAVAHNIFLDGNTFSNSHSVDRNIFVADLSIGFAITRGNTKLAYAHVFRTREFRGQDEVEVFGTVSLIRTL